MRFGISKLDLHEKLYCKELTTEVQIPYWTDDSGKKHYLELDVDNIDYSVYGELNYECIYDKENGVVKLVVDNFFDTERTLNDIDFPFKVPSELLSLDDEAIDFAGGYITVTAINIHNEQITLSKKTSIASREYVIKEDIDEDLDVYNDENDVYYYNKLCEEAMIYFGDFWITNGGYLNSVEKQFTFTMPKEILVAYMELYSYAGDENYEIEYSLQDKNGNKVYFDSKGNIVKSGTSGARETWKITIDNPYYQDDRGSGVCYLGRPDLPKEHRKYYFKTVKYRVGSIESKSNHTTEVYGYLNDSCVMGGSYSLGCKVESIGNPSINTFNAYLYVNLVDYRNTHGYIDIDESDVDIVQAGNSFDMSGKAYATYSTGTTSNLLNDVRIGILLPEGISIQEENIRLTNYDGEKVELASLTKQAYTNGRNMWIIKVDPEYYIGYYKEDTDRTSGFLDSIDNSSTIKFNITFTTSSSMTNANLNSDEMFYFTAKDLQAYRWAYNYYKEDPWDLNENGDTTDYLMKSSDEVKMSIVTDALVINVEDNISMEGEGKVTSRVGLIEKIEDVVTYSIKVNNLKSGTLRLYDHYIAIPKKNSVKDSYLVKESGTVGFDMILTKGVEFQGSDIFEAFYTVEEGLGFVDIKDLDSSKWYSSSKLLEQYTWSDITGIKVRLKNNRYVYTDFDTTIKIDMKVKSDDLEIVENCMNKWSSRVNYIFAYSSGKVGGYISTAGCGAQTTKSLVENITDSGRLAEDDTLGDPLDDTPNTYDEKWDYLYRWKLLLIMSSIVSVLMLFKIKNQI